MSLVAQWSAERSLRGSRRCKKDRAYAHCMLVACTALFRRSRETLFVRFPPKSHSTVLAPRVKRSPHPLGYCRRSDAPTLGESVMTLLAFLLAVDAVLHGLLVYRFGIKENMKFFAYVFIYAALAVAVFLNLPYVLWPALVLSVIGF